MKFDLRFHPTCLTSLRNTVNFDTYFYLISELIIISIAFKTTRYFINLSFSIKLSILAVKPISLF